MLSVATAGLRGAALTIGCIAALLATATGCMSSEPVDRQFMDNHWRLSAEGWTDARPKVLTLGDKRLPGKWTFVQEDKLIWSTVSIVKAGDKIEEGVGEIEILVANEYARTLADVLADARGAVLRLREIADPHHPPSPERWAAAVAEALVAVEGLVRVATAEPHRRDRDNPLGLTASPMLQMAAGYLNERSGGALLGDLKPGEVGRLREMLVQVILRLSFAAAGKQEPADLKAEVVRRLDGAEDLNTIEADLTKLLAAARDGASPAPADSQLQSVIEGFLKGAPPALEVMESLVRQWRKVDSLTVEFRHDGTQTLVGVSMRVKPGQQVRPARLHVAQPVVALTGSTRMVVTPKLPTTGETMVQFAPVGEGAVEVRFEGPVYGMVRLLAVPLAGAELREVRFARAAPAEGRKMLNVIMLMNALSDRGDPRRILAFQDARVVSIVREAFEVRTVTDREEQIFNYVTPEKRFFYRREKPAAPKP